MLLNKIPYRTIYVFFLSALAFGLATGEILMSIPTIALVVNWLVERKFSEKWSRVKALKYAPLYFLLLFIVHLFWSPFAENVDSAIKDLVLKLPLLAIPLVVGSSQLLSKKEWNIVVHVFIAGVLVSCLAGFGKYYLYPYEDYRDISIFISHIRLSLLIGIASLLLLLLFQNESSKGKYLYLIPLIIFVLFIRILESGTGYISLLLAIFLFITYLMVKHQNKFYFRIFTIIISMGVIIFSIIVYRAYSSLTIVKDTADKSNLEYKTPYGGDYLHDTESSLLENGYYVWLYVCTEESKHAWQTKSKIPFDSLDKKGQPIYGTLYRFLTSKGLRKDHDGVMSLTDAEVRLIESGIVTSVERKFGITARVKEVIYEVISYQQNNDPNGHSVIQRLYYTEAGWNLIKQNPIFGTTKGDEFQAYLDYYKSANSTLREKFQLRAHNQFISFFVCFGFLGGTIILIGLLMPIFAQRIHFFSLSVLIYILLSFITDDVTDTQAGVTFFSFFYCFALFATHKDYYQRSITS